MKNVFLMMLLLTTVCLMGQKVDVDGFYVPVSYANLPDNQVEPGQRTYNVNFTGENSGDELKDGLKVYGWMLTSDNPHLEVTVKSNSFVKGKSNPSSRKEETTNKDGKVTSTTYYYKVSTTNNGSGNLYINGTKNSYAEKLAQDKKNERAKPDANSKQKEREAEKEKKKEKEIAANPFLTGVETKVEEVEEAAASTSGKERVYSLSLNKSYVYTTSEQKTAVAASNEYGASHEQKFVSHRDQYPADLVAMTNSYLNDLYGFRPVKERAKFMRLDSEKHPEFSMFDNATKAITVIFEKMRYNQSLDQISKDIQPIITYFQGLADKYKTTDEKMEKRLRGAAYYNLAQIYYFLDQHDKVMEVGNAIIASDYDPKDGKRFIEKAQKMKDHLSFLNMTSRHIVPSNATESAEDLGEEVESAPEDK